MILIPQYDEDDVLREKRKSMITGGLIVGLSTLIGWCISSIGQDEQARLARIGRTHERIVTNIRNKFEDVGPFLVMHDADNPSHLCYIRENGEVVRSITVIHVDARTSMILVFEDKQTNGVLDEDQGENPLYFANPEAAMAHIKSLAK